MHNEWEHDELTDADLGFLDSLEILGRDDHADDEYAKAENNRGEFEGSGGEAGEGDTELMSADEDGEGPPEGEASEDGEDNPESGEGGSIELGELDPSQGEGEAKEKDHLESGDTDSEIQDGEDDLEFDDLDYENPEAEFEEDEDVTENREDNDDEHDDSEGAYGDEDNPVEDEDNLDEQKAWEETEHADGYPEDGQIEEDDGEGERANSDEARESDAPIEHDSNSDEAELDAEDESDIDSDVDETQMTHFDTEELETQTPEAKADADEENPDMDAQQELEDHLKENPEAEQEQKAGTTEEPTEENQRPEVSFEDVPAAGELCSNHCEDNADEDHDGECAHCKGRLKRERELWGEIATDKNDRPILPGDRLRVVVPVSFMVPGSILSANVPNFEVDPIRVAESTAKKLDEEACWLSGHSISQFTGWHLKDNGPIWTFKQGRKIRFVEKISEPQFQGHGSNDLDGGQLDSEDLVEEFKKQLEEELGNSEENDGEPETEEEENDEEEDSSENEVDNAGLDETDSDDSGRDTDNDEESGDGSDQTDESESEEDDDEEKQHRSSQLTGVQKNRFDNLTNRIIEKVKATFGHTLENIEIGEITDRGSYVSVEVTIDSRGTVFGMAMMMRKHDPELDGEGD